MQINFKGDAIMKFLSEADYVRARILCMVLLASLFLLPFRSNVIVKYFLLAEIIFLFLNGIYILYKWIRYMVKK